MARAAQAQQRASDPAPVASPVQHPSSSVAPEPLPEGGPNPSSTADAGAPDSNDDGSERQEQAAAEPAYDYASVHERQNALPSVIDMLLQSTAKRLDFYTIHDYVHAILHLVSTEVISQYKASEDPPVKVEAAEPTRLASERMPAPGQPHREPAQQERFQDPELPKFGWPTGPYLSVHAGTSSPDMNKHSRPSATEECVTSRDRNALPGSIHHHPHQAPEQQVPGETDKSSAQAGELTRLVMEAADRAVSR